MKSITQTAVRLLGSVAGMGSVIGLHASAFAAAASDFDPANSQIHVQGDNSFATGPTATSIKAFIANFGSQILDTALLLVAIVAVLFLVFYGYQYITAGGDPEKAKKARSGIINAIIGILVVALAFTIVHFAINLSAPASAVLNEPGRGQGAF